MIASTKTKLLLVLLAVLSLSLPLRSHAQDAGGQPPSDGQIIQLVAEGKFDEARQALAAVPHNDLDALFLEAQIFVRQGRPEEAVKIYRAILAVQPGQIAIRQILAQTLLQMGDLDAARFHFRTLLETDRRDGFVEQYANVLRQIDQNSPSGVSATLTFVPSTNINRGTRNETITGSSLFGDSEGTISQDSQEKSGIGVQISANGFLKFPREEGGAFYSDRLRCERHL